MQLHRFGVFLLILALAAGLLVYNARAADMNCNMVMPSVDEMAMPGGCDAGDDGGLPAADCGLPCVNAAAVLPDVPAAETAISSATARFRAVALAGRHIRPDPHPPRPALLS